MKSQRTYQFLVVLLLILPGRVFSQQGTPRIGQNSPHLFDFSENLQGKKFQNCYTVYPSDSKALYKFIPGSFYFATRGNIEIVKSNFTLQTLPFFCKEEFRFEKTTSIPLRLRLGSLDYVNRLEGKK